LPPVLRETRQRRLEDVAGRQARGDRLTSEAVVQRLAIADLDLALAGRERGGLGGATRRGVGVEAASLECFGDLAASLRPLAAQARWDCRFAMQRFRPGQ
jgi:hypothetical protein